MTVCGFRGSYSWSVAVSKHNNKLFSEPKQRHHEVLRVLQIPLKPQIVVFTSQFVAKLNKQGITC